MPKIKTKKFLLRGSEWLRRTEVIFCAISEPKLMDLNNQHDTKRETFRGAMFVTEANKIQNSARVLRP